MPLTSAKPEVCAHITKHPAGFSVGTSSFFTPQKFKYSHQKLIVLKKKWLWVLDRTGQADFMEDLGVVQPWADITLVNVDPSGCLIAWCVAWEYLHLRSTQPLCLINEWITSGLKSSRRGETACDSSPLTPSFTLVFGAGPWNVRFARPPRDGWGGTRHVLFALRNGSGLFFGGWQLVFVLESEATVTESRAKPVTVMDEVKQSSPPSFARFPHSYLPWQLAAAAHRRQEHQHRFPTAAMELYWYWYI